MNNSSVVTRVNVCNNQSFVFPGDLEQVGWSSLSSQATSAIANSDFYAISHHGSLNGDYTCFPSNAKRRVCMYRNGVYNGVPDKKVLKKANCRIGNNSKYKFVVIDLENPKINDVFHT